MKYRPEIDGLRALAVVPVVLFHAGFHFFSGGYVGVDIFFVISGYLITSLILEDLNNGQFSIIDFYERRARRILPALFLVMLISVFIGYKFMLPDEFKNLGQSLVATALFSNNILLSLTSGYWEMASEFKPLLHTWSLGVEEQFYILFPLGLVLGWKFFRKKIKVILIVAFLSSFSLACIGSKYFQDINFYLFFSRAWEILLGSLAAFEFKNSLLYSKTKKNEILSLIGFFSIFFAMFFFDKNTPQPSFFTLVPTLGTFLIILFCSEKTITYWLLSNRFMVGIGLISYSLYLWHQPLFSFARIYSMNPPGFFLMAVLILMSFSLAYLTWRYVESFFRNKNKFNRKSLSFFVLSCTLLFVFLGLFLDKNYGMPGRYYSSSIKAEDLDKRIYNMGVFRFKKDEFQDLKKIKILVVGNSFARDFVNIVNESFDLQNVELIYRNDFKPCINPFESSLTENLYELADIIVNSGNMDYSCVDINIEFAKKKKKNIFYIGQKKFGYNLNWLIRLDFNSRANQYNVAPFELLLAEEKNTTLIPKVNYISLISPVLKEGKIPITDNFGNLLSTDRDHLTKSGAIFFGKIVKASMFGDLLLQKKTNL